MMGLNGVPTMSSIRLPEELEDAIKLAAQIAIIIVGIAMIRSFLQAPEATAPEGNEMTQGLTCHKYAEGVFCR